MNAALKAEAQFWRSMLEAVIASPLPTPPGAAELRIACNLLIVGAQSTHAQFTRALEIAGVLAAGGSFENAEAFHPELTSGNELQILFLLTGKMLLVQEPGADGSYQHALGLAEAMFFSGLDAARARYPVLVQTMELEALS